MTSGKSRPPGGTDDVRQHRRRFVFYAQIIFIAAILAGAGFAAYAERDMVQRGFGALGRANLVLVFAAIVAEALSMFGFALVQYQILRAGGARLSVQWLLSTVYAANVIAVGVPVIGSGMATGFAYQQFRKRNVSPEVSTYVLWAAGVISTVSFAAVAVVAAILSGNAEIAESAVACGGFCLLVAGLFAWAMATARGRALVERSATRVLIWSGGHLHRPRGDPAVITTDFVDRFRSIHLGPVTTASAFMWAMLNWLADALCFALALWAVGVSAPVRIILVVWLAGNAASSFSPTPGGVAVVDVAMIATLIAVGVRGPAAIAAVLLYRIVAFKVVLSSIWLLWRWRLERSDRTNSAGSHRPSQLSR